MYAPDLAGDSRFIPTVCAAFAWRSAFLRFGICRARALCRALPGNAAQNFRRGYWRAVKFASVLLFPYGTAEKPDMGA